MDSELVSMIMRAWGRGIWRFGDWSCFMWLNFGYYRDLGCKIGIVGDHMVEF